MNGHAVHQRSPNRGVTGFTRRHAPLEITPARARPKGLWGGLFLTGHATIGIAFFVFLALLLTLSPLLQRRELVIDVFDVGQGDAILITTPTRERILVDGGPDASVVAKLSRRLGFFNRTIDFMIPTHPQADHITGLLSVFDRFAVKRVMLTTISNETPEYRALRKTIAAHHVPTLDAGATSTMTVGEEHAVTIDVLWPRRTYADRLVDDPNIVSTIFRLTYGDTRFLFTGDADAAVEHALLEEGVDLHADALKVGHHGSDTSTTQQFLDAVNPSIAAISLGRNNRFGHPSRRVLRRLERAGVAAYRTDLVGDIRITSDGKKIRVTPQRR